MHTWREGRHGLRLPLVIRWFSSVTPALTWGSPGTLQTQPGGQWQPAICWGGVGGAQGSGTHVPGTSGGGCYSNHLCSEQPWLGQCTLPVVYENVFSNNQSPGPKIVHVDNREQITWQFLNGQMMDVLSIQRLLKLVACKDFPVWLCTARSFIIICKEMYSRCDYVELNCYGRLDPLTLRFSGLVHWSFPSLVLAIW